jgi:uncharacterized phage protein (TIGR02216 family)
MSSQKPASWQELMAFAFGVLKLTPDTFWAMTPREFDASAKPYLPFNNTTQRADLFEMMNAFPDQ